MLDGYPVNMGDPVHVLGLGSGTVISTNMDGGFTVRVGTGEMYFRDGGYVGNQKRVFWADPMIVVPPKDTKFWRAFVKTATVLYEQAEVFYESGMSEENNEGSRKA